MVKTPILGAVTVLFALGLGTARGGPPMHTQEEPQDSEAPPACCSEEQDEAGDEQREAREEELEQRLEEQRARLEEQAERVEHDAEREAERLEQRLDEARERLEATRERTEEELERRLEVALREHERSAERLGHPQPPEPPDDMTQQEVEQDGEDDRQQQPAREMERVAGREDEQPRKRHRAHPALPEQRLAEPPQVRRTLLSLAQLATARRVTVLRDGDVRILFARWRCLPHAVAP
jgi:hypothetical protein